MFILCDLGVVLDLVGHALVLGLVLGLGGHEILRGG